MTTTSPPPAQTSNRVAILKTRTLRRPISRSIFILLTQRVSFSIERVGRSRLLTTGAKVGRAPKIEMLTIRNLPIVKRLYVGFWTWPVASGSAESFPECKLRTAKLSHWAVEV
jgi:hypothetical protein